MFINQNENISNRVVNFRQAQTARNNTGIKKNQRMKPYPKIKKRRNMKTQ